MLIVLRENNGSNNYYGSWCVDKDNVPQIVTVYDDTQNAKVLKMYGFQIHFGDHEPPDAIKEKLLNNWHPVPVKIVLLA